MQHLATTGNASGRFSIFQDWRRVFKSLAELEELVDPDELVEVQKVYKACIDAAHMVFVDNHNAGYYVNSYTTKLNPSLDNVLKDSWRVCAVCRASGKSRQLRRNPKAPRRKSIMKNRQLGKTFPTDYAGVF